MKAHILFSFSIGAIICVVCRKETPSGWNYYWSLIGLQNLNNLGCSFGNLTNDASGKMAWLTISQTVNVEWGGTSLTEGYFSALLCYSKWRVKLYVILQSFDIKFIKLMTCTFFFLMLAMIYINSFWQAAVLKEKYNIDLRVMGITGSRSMLLSGT